jgi:hypothetical protein
VDASVVLQGRAVRRSCTVLVAAAIAVPACQLRDDDDAPAAASAPATAPATDESVGTKIAVECRASGSLDLAQRESIERIATTIVVELRAGHFEGLWEFLHPQARRDDEREPFMRALEGMRSRLADVHDEPRVESLHVVDVKGGANDLAQVHCGSGPDDPLGFDWLANVGGEDLAVVSVRATGEAFRYAVTVQLRQRGDAWHLVGIHVDPSAFRDRTALDFERSSDELARAGKPLAAFLSLGVAQTLAERGESITTVDERRIDGKLEALQRNATLLAQTDAWTVGDVGFDLHGVTLAATRTDISPVVKYVTKTGLDRAKLDPEVDVLVAHVRKAYPEIAQSFESIVFEAYAEPPLEPGKAYDAFRVARPLAAPP